MNNQKKSQSIYQNIIQFIKFGLVGASNTLVSYVIYIVSLFLMQSINLLQNIDYIISNILSFLISVLWSFYWNNKFVFTLEENQERSWIKALAKTYCAYAFTGLFLNNILIIIWVDMLGINKLIAPIINLIFSIPINFVLNKFWAFKKYEKE